MPLASPLADEAVPYIRLFTPARHNSREGWVAEMKRLLDEGKNLKLALLVTAAKADLDHGEWTAIWRSEDRPFAKGKADKLFFIGRNLGGLNAPDRECLPLSLSALCSTRWPISIWKLWLPISVPAASTGK